MFKTKRFRIFLQWQILSVLPVFSYWCAICRFSNLNSYAKLIFPIYKSLILSFFGRNKNVAADSPWKALEIWIWKTPYLVVIYSVWNMEHGTWNMYYVKCNMFWPQKGGVHVCGRYKTRETNGPECRSRKWNSWRHALFSIWIRTSIVTIGNGPRHFRNSGQRQKSRRWCGRVKKICCQDSDKTPQNHICKQNVNI